MNTWKFKDEYFPLLLTVDAAEAIEDRYASWADVAPAIGSGGKGKVAKELAFLLETLTRGGCEAVKAMAGDPAGGEPPAPPTADLIRATMTPGAVVGLRDLVLDTIREGLETSVEVDHEKNGVTTQGG